MEELPKVAKMRSLAAIQGVGKIEKHGEERKMKTPSKATQRKLVCLAIACLVVGLATSAFAVPSKQVSKILNAQTFTGKCCFLWNQTVSLTEPAAVAPVIVTWSADVVINDEFLVGLSLNGGPCTAFGSREIPFLTLQGGSGALTATHQWVVLPGDGLVKGNNTFALCGGGASSSSDSISFGLSTLTVLK